MYTLKTEHSFDAAHFLYGYEGKCSNIHGHRWRVVAEVSSDELETTGQNRGMYVDFGDLKKDLKEIIGRGYKVKQITVYETPNNSASYTQD